jgi:hypothetical protein
MLRAMSNAPVQPSRLAIVAAVAFVGANLAFYVLSSGYFDSHRQVVPGVGTVPSFSPTQMQNVRVAFAVFSAIVAGAGFLGALRARVIGHLLPVVLGAAHLVAAVGAFSRGLPGVLGVTLLISGVLLPVLSWRSYAQRSRAAWSFLLALSAVFAVVGLFGAPKMRGALDVGLWTTMILPGLHGVAAFVLRSLRGEYGDHEPVAA